MKNTDKINKLKAKVRKWEERALIAEDNSEYWEDEYDSVAYLLGKALERLGPDDTDGLDIPLT